MFRLALLGLVFVMELSGQVRLVVTSDKTEYHIGETIRLKLHFTASVPNAFQAGQRIYDRACRLNGVEEFLLEPSDVAEDPQHNLFCETGGMGGIMGGPLPLSDKPYVVERILNEWLRFRKPGTYQLRVVSHRIGRVAHSQSIDASVVVSDTIPLTIYRPTAKWVRDQIAAATKVLDAPVINWSKESDSRLEAMQTLRFLNTPQAAIELAKRVKDFNFGVLWDTPYRAPVLAVLENRLIAPDDDMVELNGLSSLAEMAAFGGPLPPFRKKDPAQRRRRGWKSRSVAMFSASRNTMSTHALWSGHYPPNNQKPETFAWPGCCPTRCLGKGGLTGSTRSPIRSLWILASCSRNGR